MSRPFQYTLALVACISALSACSGGPDPAVSAQSEPDQSFLTQVAPEGAAPGTCWGKTVSPAVIETVTEQVLVTAARLDDDGQVIAPARYRTETRQEIVRERQETWFETLCPDRMTPDFIRSLQRALTVRGVYAGQINGVMDAATRTAVRRYQTPRGTASGIPSLATAQELGLAAVPPAG